MRVLVTGASGFTGRAVVRAALAAGVEVTALTRDLHRIPPAPGLTRVTAQTTDGDALHRVLPGHDAVIHCLGVGGHGNGRATTVVSEMTSHLVPAMIDTGVNRLIALSNIGAGSSVDQGPWAYRTLIRPVVLGIFLRWLRPIIEDKNRMESIIMASPLQWTIVRLPNVVDRPSRQSLRISTGRAAVGLSIGRSDLAEFLLAAVLLPASVKVAASVSN